MYLFFVMLAAMAFNANFAQEVSTPYVSIICFLFVTPTILLDRTWRVTLCCTLMLLLAIVFSYMYKSRAFFQSDLTNVLTYYFAGNILGINIRRIRLKGFDTTRILALERNTDPLTNLSNRRRLFEYLHRGIKDSLMRPTGMFMIDIDKFKLFNDTYGHRSGDMCLRAIGQCFEKFGRMNNLKFFRYGGEEFCALCWTKNYSELGVAGAELVEAVRELSIPFTTEESVADVVTISLGFSKFTKDDPYNFEDMIKITDSALYKAKNGGRNRVVGAEESMWNFVDHL